MRRWLNGRTGIAALCLGTLFGCASTGASNNARNVLSIQSRAPYKDSTLVRDVIKSECRLEETVPKWVQKYTRGNFDDVVLVDQISPATQGTVMKLEINGAEGLGGSLFTGSKSLTISGTLWKDGNVIGSFTASRSAMGGLIKARTCSILTRSAKRIGKDVGKWIEHPTMNAKLGFRDDKPSRKANGETAEKDEDEEEKE